MRRAQPLVLALLLGFLALVGQVTGAYEENVQAVRDLGTSKGEPINTGYVFINDLYVAPPYVVERRGLAILLNGHCIRPGGQYPEPDDDVKNDPGDPPPGTAPFTDETGYWDRKCLYLIDRFGRATAKGMLMDLYRKCGAYKRVYADPEKDGNPVCVDHQGKEYVIILSAVTVGEKRTKEQLIISAEGGKIFYEELLRRGDVISLKGGCQAGWPGDAGLKLMEALVSTDDLEGKVALMKREDLYTLGDAEMRQLIEGFKATAELRKRVEAARIEARLKTTTEDIPVPHLDWPSPSVRRQLPHEDLEEGEKQMDRTTKATCTGQTGITWLAVGACATGLFFLAWGVVRWVRIHK